MADKRNTAISRCKTALSSFFENNYNSFESFYKLIENYENYLYTDTNDDTYLVLTVSKQLVLDTKNNKIVIKNRFNVSLTDYILLGYENVGGNPYLYGRIAQEYYTEKFKQGINADIPLLAYMSRGNIIKKQSLANGNVKIIFTDSISIVIAGNTFEIAYNKIQQDIGDACVVTELTAGQTGTGYPGFAIETPIYRFSLNINISNKKLYYRTNYGYAYPDEFSLINTTFNNISGGILVHYYYRGLIQDASLSNIPVSVDHFLTDGEKYDITGYNIDTKITTYNTEFINRNEDTESYLYFTDPHCINSGVTDTNARKVINTIEYAFNKTPTTYVICGGDWLSNGDTQLIAVDRLSYIDGFMRHKFGDAYIPIIGNHDNNYQGILETGSANNTGRLPQETMQRLWFRNYGNKTYYTKLGLNSRFYIFDTEIDWTANTISDFKWEQVDWFGKELIKNDDKHSIMLMHIISNQWDDGGTGDKTYRLNNEGLIPVIMQKYLMQIAQAYNTKTNITLNNISYDFSSTTGKIAFCHVGHMHFDWNGVYNNIPIIITTNTTTEPRFDLCLVDYTNAKYILKRVGYGDDREIDIVV